MRLCFRICKKPVFSRRGSYNGYKRAWAHGTCSTKLTYMYIALHSLERNTIRLETKVDCICYVHSAIRTVWWITTSKCTVPCVTCNLKPMCWSFIGNATNVNLKVWAAQEKKYQFHQMNTQSFMSFARSNMKFCGMQMPHCFFFYRKSSKT